MRFVLFISLFFLSASTAEVGALKKARQGFPELGNLDEQVSALLDELSPLRSAEAQAYRGAFMIMSAQHTSYPLRKYNRFVAGKKLLENAISRKSQLAELRYVRILIQCNTPEFLNYNSNINSDLLFLVKHKNQLLKQAGLHQRVKLNLTRLEGLSDQQLKLIHKI